MARTPIADDIPTDIAWVVGNRIMVSCTPGSTLSRALSWKMKSTRDAETGALRTSSANRGRLVPLIREYIAAGNHAPADAQIAQGLAAAKTAPAPAVAVAAKSQPAAPAPTGEVTGEIIRYGEVLPRRDYAVQPGGRIRMRDGRYGIVVTVSTTWADGECCQHDDIPGDDHYHVIYTVAVAPATETEAAAEKAATAERREYAAAARVRAAERAARTEIPAHVEPPTKDTHRVALGPDHWALIEAHRRVIFVERRAADGDTWHDGNGLGPCTTAVQVPWSQALADDLATCGAAS